MGFKSVRIGTVLLAATLISACAATGKKPPPTAEAPVRIVTADVVAINQPLVYNRFGSLNPWGMIYALRGDLADPSAGAGTARLKDERRPRPLVLRVSEGDELRIRFQNLLAPVQRVDGKAQCAVAEEPEADPGSGEAADAHGVAPDMDEFTVPHPPNDPCTRRAGIAVVGLPALNGSDAAATGLTNPAPGDPPFEYRFRAEKEGAYFFSSLAAVAGGEGDGGSLTHGLFGMVIVEPKGSRYYRSQVAQQDLDCARDLPSGGPDCFSDPGASWLDYEASRKGKPLLNMLRRHGNGNFEVVHGDLTAIVVNDKAADNVGQPPAAKPRAGSMAWREFAIMFHDELKTIHHPDFDVLNDPKKGASEAAKARHQQMVGTRDGFGINYGASGMGPIVLANRVEKGPARDCVDCAYEEFFLQSWANGDPALLAEYADDPSNVYHSYLGDRVKFHNVHAGPKETHVFHLHAHQWLSQLTDPETGKKARGNYLDSQTIAPFQTFTYEIYYGGTGNRNLTPGDSIFHCHLYPHFAQGMWALWRVHEVLEDGSRKLPDRGGVWRFDAKAGWGYDAAANAGTGTDRETGATAAGTPIPALVPLPGEAMPPEPTYASSAAAHVQAKADPVMPGYPFYIPGRAGYRAPQPPKDLVEDAGLPRHITLEPAECTGGINGCARTMSPIETALDEGDMTFEIKKARIAILPDAGDRFEKEAMLWHAGLPAGENPWEPESSTRGYRPSLLVDRYRDGVGRRFLVNGIGPAPGAPFANPCPLKPKTANHWVRGLPSLATGEREYSVSAIELELVVNQYGWHDKQARINVLSSDVEDYEGRRRAADPFFFRAHSGECVVFEHTNRTPAHTKKDAFQVATPTDIIGQHIHLVKFDVTSSDGSANGYNYEDGTLAREHIEHLIHAANAPGGSAFEAETGAPVTLEAKTSAGKPVYQTSIQRWWADPLLDEQRRDRTIGTVFTHDHFAPSTIQQHGFYSALLVEPAGKGWESVWKKPDGTPLESGVGTQAIIEVPKNARDVSPELRGPRREFALAVADFALLYDSSDKPIAPPHGDPTRPEAISVDHHDPYLFNYKNEPVPLRIGPASGSNWQQFNNRFGDMANLFDSTVHKDNPNGHSDLSTVDLRNNHSLGDPSTEIFEAYDGDRVQVRLIQGAQEVQHNFTVHGQKWRRHSADRFAPWVSSQEIGISEHFEMDLQLQPVTMGDRKRLWNDFLYHAGTVDSIWNGAWGFFRSYSDPAETTDPSRSESSRPVRCRLAVLGTDRRQAPDPACDGDVAATASADAPTVAQFLGVPPGNAFRDPEAAGRLFCIDAVDAPITYNGRNQIHDPSGVRYVLRAQYVLEPGAPPPCPTSATGPLAAARELPVPADDGKPLILRVRSGEMVYVHLSNRLSAPLGRTTGNAVLPPIVSTGPGQAPNDLNDRLTPSSQIGIHASLVSYAVRHSDGSRVGLNTARGDQPGLVPRESLSSALLSWYAGVADSRRDGNDVTVRWTPFRTDTGMVATLSSMADPIRHPAAGLVGALVIEPEDALLDQAYLNGQVKEGGTSARMCRRSGECWDEFVLVYQDGLNLKQTEGTVSKAIPDCHVCDDTYDSGDHALNYRTEPLWARLGLPREVLDAETGKSHLVDLSGYDLPDGLLHPDFAPVATPTFCTSAGNRVIVHAVHPGGRARQRAFVTYGNRYDDMGLPKFGSPSSSLLGPQKAVTMDLGRVAEGLWLYRDGPAYMVAGGAWGFIDARKNRPSNACPAP